MLIMILNGQIKQVEALVLLVRMAATTLLLLILMVI
jgi:hypothetical protein